MLNREHFNVGEAEYRWTTQDYSTADGIPLIGALDDNGLYIATGFGGWGLTTAGVAAAIIRDSITQDQVTGEYRGIFDPRRELSAVDSALISARTSSGTDRDDSGELEAVSAVCTHLGGIVL